MKTIRLNPKNNRTGGVFSKYHFFRGKGVKVINARDDGNETFPEDGFYSTPEELSHSPLWNDAVEEAETIRLLSGSGYTPKFYEVVAVQYNKNGEPKFYLPGIVMEHIRGVELEYFDINHLTRKNKFDICNELEDKIFTEYGIEARDIHPANVIVRNNDFNDLVVIDFSPEYTKVLGFTNV